MVKEPQHGFNLSSLDLSAIFSLEMTTLPVKLLAQLRSDLVRHGLKGCLIFMTFSLQVANAAGSPIVDGVAATKSRSFACTIDT